MKYKRVILGSSIVTAVGTLLYWTLYFTGVMPVVEVVPGYETWFRSFVLPDFWLAIISALLAFAVITERKALMITSGLLTASSMFFLAFNELGFSIDTGMILLPLSDTWVDFTIKILLLSCGTFYIKQFSGEVGKALALSKEQAK